MRTVLQQAKQLLSAALEGLQLAREVKSIRSPQEVHARMHRWKMQNGGVCCGGGCK